MDAMVESGNMSRTLPGTPVIFGEVLFDNFLADGNMVLGGAPFNVAWNLQAMGQLPHLVSRVGDDDLGDRIVGAMDDWDMDRSGIQVDDMVPTGEVRVTVKDREPSFEITADRAYDFISTDELSPPEPVGLLYHGSLALRSSSPQVALDHLRKVSGSPVLMDVNLRDPWWNPDQVMGLMDQSTWVKLNEDELAALVPGETRTEQQAARLFEQGGMEVLIVTRGAAGALTQGREGWILEPEPVPAAKVIDTVGAGDAFSSVVICGLMRGWPWSLILERAQSFAAAVVGLQGATSRDRSFYDSIFKNWEHS
jgi:fructokinase